MGVLSDAGNEGVCIVQRKIIDNALLIDSLNEKIKAEDLYLYKVKSILQGKIPMDSVDQIKAVKDTTIDLNDLEYISIKTILEAYNNLGVERMRTILKNEISKNKKLYKNCHHWKSN